MTKKYHPGPYGDGQVAGLMNLMDHAMRINGQYQARMNRGDTVTPFGSVTHRQTADGRWISNQALSPREQALHDRQQGGQMELARQTNQMIGQLGGMRLTNENLPQVRRKLGDRALADAYANLPARPLRTDFRNLQRESANRAFNEQWRQQKRVFDRDLEALETRLANMGITRGSRAHGRELDRFDARKDQAVAAMADQAWRAGEQARRGAFADGLAERQQRFGELGQIFDQQSRSRAQIFGERQAKVDTDLKKLGLAASLQRAPDLPQPAPMAGVGVPGTDAGDAFGNMRARNQGKDQIRNGLIGSILGVMPKFGGGS